MSKRGNAVADPQSNILFVNDIPSKLEEIRKFVRAIDTGARQVMIEARLGLQEAVVTKAWVKRIPSRASWSRRGVWTFWLP